MVIVDNAAYSFAYQVVLLLLIFNLQIDNGIPILSFYNDKNDKELLDLVEYLKLLNNYEDLILANRKMLKMSKFKDYDNPQ